MTAPEGEINQLRFPPGSVAFDLLAFDRAIKAHGVRFIHWRAMPDPVGMVDRHDVRRPGEDHFGASNGMIYTRAGAASCLFTGNSKDLRAAAQGWISAAQAQITAERFYCQCSARCAGSCGDDRVYLAPADRLYLEDESVLVPATQVGAVTALGVDRLKFPAVRVQDLVDATGRRWRSDQVSVKDGRVVWSSADMPPAGTVYSIRYLMHPFWYVNRLLHETRVAQQTGPAGRHTEAGPQSAIIHREYVHQATEDRDPRAPTPDSSRQAETPESPVVRPTKTLAELLGER